MNEEISIRELFPGVPLLPSNNIVNILYHRLKDLILSEKLPSGYYFPNENEMCKTLGIGRTTLREAYKALEMHGFITRSKKGTIVNSSDEIARNLPLATAIELSDFTDFIEFRAVFESQIAGMAAERANNDQIDMLHKMLEKMRQHRNETQKLTFYDTQFHMILAEASQNRLMRRIMLMSDDVFTSGVYKAFSVDTAHNIEQALEAHAKILNAVENRDVDGANLAMFEHIQTIRNRGIEIE